jgi:PAS domain S-box-containing protein
MRREGRSNLYVRVFVVITALLLLAQLIVQRNLHQEIETALRSGEGMRGSAVWELRTLESALSAVTLLTLTICGFLIIQPNAKRLQQALVALNTAQQALQTAETRYRLLAQYSRDAIALYHLDGRLSYVNPAYSKMTGYSEPEMLAMSPQETNALAHPDDRPRIQEWLRPHLLSGEWADGFEYRLQRKDGDYLWVESYVVPVFDANDQMQYFLATTRDISERKRAEFDMQTTMDALLDSEKRFSAAFHSSPVPMVISTIDSQHPVYVEVNEAYLSLVGYTWEELRGRSPIEVGIAIPGSERNSRMEVLAQESQYVMREAQICNRNGLVRDVMISAQRMNTEGQEYDIEILLDITERKQNAYFAQELERLKARFREDEAHNQLIRRTISALSHDLRTPLAIISTSRDTLSRYAEHLLPEQRKEKLDAIGRQLQFMRELLDDLSTLMNDSLAAREFKPAPVNIAALCQVCVDEIRNMSLDSHTIQFVNHDMRGIVRLDEILVNRILTNLLTNAIKYSPEGGAIQLRLENKGDSIVLCVSDEGMGIAAEDLPHIFEAYYRVQSGYTIAGTGLGLNIVKDCVDRHHGTITVESEVGKGTTFTVILPLQAAP